MSIWSRINCSCMLWNICKLFKTNEIYQSLFYLHYILIKIEHFILRLIQYLTSIVYDNNYTDVWTIMLKTTKLHLPPTTLPIIDPYRTTTTTISNHLHHHHPPTSGHYQHHQEFTSDNRHYQLPPSTTHLRPLSPSLPPSTTIIIVGPARSFDH